MHGLPMNTKRKGNRFEHRSRRLLEAAGYRVTRAAASLGTFDLVGGQLSGCCPREGQRTRLARGSGDGADQALSRTRQCPQAHPPVARQAGDAGCARAMTDYTSSLANPQRPLLLTQSSVLE